MGRVFACYDQVLAQHELNHEDKMVKIILKYTASERPA